LLNLYLVRVAQNKEATFGVLVKESKTPFVLTLERIWNDNQRGKSCIPFGTYTCLRCRKSKDYNFKDSPNFGNTFQVINIPGRMYVLFHKGNIHIDTHGCICVGEKFDPVKGTDGIAQSTQGYEEFLNYLKDVDEFKLHIIPRMMDEYFFAGGST
jgi:hypothetical protein